MKSKGFTLIELIIVVFIIGIVALIFGGFIAKGLTSNSSSKDPMLEYVQFMHPGADSIRTKCQDYDSDGDGYVRCMASFTSNGVSQNEVAECPAALSLNSECVPMKGVVIR